MADSTTTEEKDVAAEEIASDAQPKNEEPKKDELLEEATDVSKSDLMAYEENHEPVQYELTYLLVPTVNDVEQASVSEHIRKIIEKNSGKVADESIWGKQKLSYEIQGHSMGVYVVLKLHLPPSAVSQLEKELKLLEPVLRHLIIRKDSDKLKRMKEERDGKRRSRRERNETPKSKTDKVAEKFSDGEPDMEVLSPEKAEKIEAELEEEKKATTDKDLKKIDDKLDEILDEELTGEDDKDAKLK